MPATGLKKAGTVVTKDCKSCETLKENTWLNISQLIRFERASQRLPEVSSVLKCLKSVKREGDVT